MCGIAGYLAGYSPDVATAMAKLIAHRGPDDEGLFFDADARLALVHRRLSIIDLSGAGHQPMTDPSGRFTICYNGEVYNYRELKVELEGAGVRLRGHSDTEVVLALFARSGAACFARLNGIFALAIWDSHQRSLILARDGIGVKPLYLCETGRGVAFASEIKAFLALPDMDTVLDPLAAISYLTYLWTPGERTMLQSVKKLDPGTWLKIGADGRRESGTFYRLPLPRPNRNLSDADVIAGTECALRTAVDRQMVADVDVGAFLSGGLDSSAIVAFARKKAHRRLQCFTIAYEEGAANDEIVPDLPYARRAAEYLDVDLHEVKVGAFTAEDFERLVYQLDEPQADPAAISSYYIAGLARSCGIKVLLSGTGGDDLFTGYRRHIAADWDVVWSRTPAGARSAIARSAALMPGHSAIARRMRKVLSGIAGSADQRIAGMFEWFPAEGAASLLAKAPPGAAAAVRAPMLEALAGLDSRSAVDRMLRLDQKFFLTDHNLNYTDKTGMAEGVEIRVPFLDPDLVAWAAELPADAKIRRGVTKWALRKAMESHLPHDIIYRPKSGFGVPMRSWLRTTMRPLLEELTDPRTVQTRGLFDAAAVSRLKEDTLGGRVDGAYTLLGVMAIELWLKRFATGATAAKAA